MDDIKVWLVYRVEGAETLKGVIVGDGAKKIFLKNNKNVYLKQIKNLSPKSVLV